MIKRKSYFIERGNYMDMFELLAQKEMENQAPLAERMKPESLDTFFGQKRVVGEDKVLYSMIMKDRLTSLILYGPPGSGKTSLARIIAKQTKAHFVTLNAVASGVKEIRATVEEAKENQMLYKRKTVLFIDEIHRFNKSQQDALLPYVENGTVILIGATTENPYFEVNSALLSRSTLLRLEALTESDIKAILINALKDDKKGLGIYEITVDEEALTFMASHSGGDARRALNLLETTVFAEEDLNAKINIGIESIQRCMQMNASLYDKSGDYHYDIVSAFIKSMRGSDPDAALFYLGKMIHSGEDPRFIARRVVICASEDVGNADPMALVVANNAAQAVDFIGMPEGRIILAQAVTYVASAPKSNAAYVGINKVLELIENETIGPMPYYLKDGTSLKLERHYVKDEGGHAYLYPHAYEGGYVHQQYLPTEIKDKRFYEPKPIGKEKEILAYLNRTKFNNE